MALAVSVKGLSDTSVGLAVSALFPRIPGNKLVFDPTGTAGGKVDLGAAGAFPAFPDRRDSTTPTPRRARWAAAPSSSPPPRR